MGVESLVSCVVLGRELASHPMTPARRLIRCLLATNLMWVLSTAALAGPTDSGWFVHVWQSDEGLPNNSVSSLAQTTDGYLWAANSSRLVRFDGVEFEIFSPKDFGTDSGQRVHVLLQSKSGGLWLATDHGTVVYLKEGIAKVITNGLPDVAAQALTEDAEGTLWITFSRGVIYHLKNGAATMLGPEAGLPAGPACSMARDNEGRLWVAKSEEGSGQVGILRDGHFQSLLRFEPATIRLAAARGGGIWICAGSKLYKFYKYNVGGKLEEMGASMPEQASRKPKVIFEDQRGAIWVGTSDSGLFRFDGIEFEKVPTSHPQIADLMEDGEGNMWVATSGGGLNRVQQRTVELERVNALNQDLPFVTVTSMCEDTNGVLWGATQNGYLACRTNGAWSVVATNASRPSGFVSCVAADRTGAVWIGTRDHALYRLNDGHLTAWGPTDGLESHSIRSLLASSNGDLWIGGEVPKALQRLRDGKFRAFDVPLGVRHIRAMAEDSAGNIWVGTSGGYLLRINGDTVTEETSPTTGGVLAIRCLYTTPDDTLWIGYAAGGLGRLKQGRYARIRASQGLYDDAISQILDDGRGWLWFGADHGIFKIRRQELDAIAEGSASRVRSTHYGRDEGLSSLQASFDVAPGAIRSRDGLLWIPMRTALAVINSSDLRENLGATPVLLKRMFVDERVVAAYGGVMPVSKVVGLPAAQGTLRLPPRHHLLEFEFTALYFSAPENVHFRYRLEGFDEDWVEADAKRGERRATYPQLPAANYRFRVAACNSDGVWNESGAPLAFIVTPFVWQTWWFRATTVISFTLVVAAIVWYVSSRRLRIKLRMLEQQAALDRERARIARDLHDDLGGSLMQVSLLLDMTRRDLGSPDKAGKGVQQCSLKMHQVVESVDEIIWAINPRNDTARYLIDYLSQFAVEFLEAANIPCRVELPERIPDLSVSPEARHNLFLVVKETLNNIARHAQASEIRLQVTATEDSLGILVEDNGHGFERAPDNASADGLRNMRQRMEEISGQFQIESQVGRGTRVSFRYPWPQKNQ